MEADIPAHLLRGITGLDPAVHPPHIHRPIAPGGDVRPAWRILAHLIACRGGEPVTEPPSGVWEKVRQLDAEGEGGLVNNLLFR